MNKYQKNKTRAREEAIEWQYTFADHDYSYAELSVFTDHFMKLAKAYGLVEEFRENGII